MIQIPANPDHSSLNLAQAVQVLAYECRMAMLNEMSTDTQSNSIGFHGTPATLEQIDGMFAHLERALIAAEFLHPQAPQKLMPILRRMVARCNLETEEINIIRGISSQIESLAKK